MNEPFDFAVIGGGSAGYAAASTAVGLGLKTVVIDGGAEVGGLCILRGCMPSKTLLESAHRAESIRRAAEFGLRAEYHGADGAAIRARKRRLIAEFADYRRGQLEDGRFEFVRGHAQFADAQALEVELLAGGSRRIEARTFLIATGSRVNYPEIPGLHEVSPWTSDDVLDSAYIPQSVIVLGGGAIALEVASYYGGLGCAVTVIQRSAHVLKEMDADVADAVVEALGSRGISVFRNTTIRHVERHGTLKRVVFDQAGEKRQVDAEEIVYALGRQPNTAQLGLARAGLASGKSAKLAIDARQQSSQPHIFGAGDVCGPHEVVHIAVQQAEIAARNAARLLGKSGGAWEEMDYRLKLFAVFSQPEAAAVGLTEAEAAQLGLDFVTATSPFSDHGKSMVRGETHGFVKLIAERETRRIVGAACVGPEAAELIHEVVVAMHFHGTAGDLARVPHYHPTLSEIWTYPAEELASI